MSGRKLLVIAFGVIVFVGFGLHASKASADACDASVYSSPTSTYPRDSLAFDPSAGCAGVSAGNQFVFLSSYYYNNANSYSTLYTPKASFYFYTVGAPTGAQGVSITAAGGLCNPVGNNKDIYADYGGSGAYIGGTSWTLTIPASDFSLDTSLGSNVYKTNNKLNAQINAQVSGTYSKIACPVSVGVMGGASVSITYDANPTQVFCAPNCASYSNQRFNQANQGSNNPALGVSTSGRKALGPTALNQSNAVAVALWSTYGSDSSRLEYHLPFATPCNIGANTTIYLRYYDADGLQPLAAVPPGSDNPTQGDDMTMQVFDVTGAKSNIFGTFPVLGSNDEYNEYAITVQPAHKYDWIWNNVKPHNGVQIWQPFSDIGSASNVSCTPPSYTCNVYIDNVVHPGDPIYFHVDVSGIPNWNTYDLALNGANFPKSAGEGTMNNFLINNAPSRAIRGSPSGVGGGPDTALVFNGYPNTYFDDMVYTDYSDPAHYGGISPQSPPTLFYAKDIWGNNLSAGVDYPFDWAVLKPNVGFLSGAVCKGSVHITPLSTDAATCLTASIANDPNTTYPNSQFTVSITVRNDGNTTWVPGTFNLGSHQGLDNNYVTDGGGEIRANWPDGNWVIPGGQVTFTYTATLPSYGATYPSNWKMVHEGVPNGWLNFTNGTQCGLSFTVVQGRFGDAYNWGNAEPGSVDTCSEGTVNTGQNGFYTFAVPSGWGYCLVPSSSKSPDSIFVRPFSEGYATRNAAGTNIACAPNTYCAASAATAVTSYQCQLANAHGWPACGSGQEDRAMDSGFDFALSWAPVVSCQTLPQSFSVGSTFTPVVYIQNAQGGGLGPVGTTPQTNPNNINYSIDTAPAQTAKGTTGTMFVGSLFIPFTLDNAITISQPGTYTGTITVDWASGIYTGTARCPQNVRAYLNPYLKTYGADVWSGGSFDSTCSSGGTHVYAYATGSGTAYKGASAQFGVSALLNINGFFSSSLRTTANSPPKGTTFSNTAGGATYGGGYDTTAGAGACFTDYYTKTKKSSGATATTSIDAAVSSSSTTPSQFGLSTNTMGGSAGTNLVIPKGHQLVVYVNGDITINRNIVYDSSVRTSTSDIPLFILVAKGNIYIDPSVTNIDGLYVAQPKDVAPGNNNDPNSGRIYTCYPSGGITPANIANLYNLCGGQAGVSGQLVVNGALVAEQIKYLRTFGNLANATIPEPYNSTNAGEVINFSPEMYLAPSPLVDPANPTPTSSVLPYTAVYSLPPVF